MVAGASEGVGSAFADEVARLGLDVVLLARRGEVLEGVAGGIRARHGVEAITLTVDLSEPGASARVIDATDDLEVGLLMYNAGAAPDYAPFLDSPAESSVAMLQRNCVVPTELCHHFGTAMVGRGRGGIILVTSGAALAGAPNMATYGATKAYDMILAEALWAELRDTGVDVLSLMLGETDTPALRRLRANLGHTDDPDAPLPGATDVGEVVQDAILHLADGPSRLANELLRDSWSAVFGPQRKELVQLMTDAGAATMGRQGGAEDD